jgi:hypothetical protein
MAKISIAESFSCPKERPVANKSCDVEAKEFINEEVPKQLNNYTCNVTSVDHHRALLVVCSGEKTKTPPPPPIPKFRFPKEAYR